MREGMREETTYLEGLLVHFKSRCIVCSVHAVFSIEEEIMG